MDVVAGTAGSSLVGKVLQKETDRVDLQGRKLNNFKLLSFGMNLLKFVCL